jgi:hypothetical protein
LSSSRAFPFEFDLQVGNSFGFLFSESLLTAADSSSSLPPPKAAAAARNWQFYESILWHSLSCGKTNCGGFSLALL